MPSAGQGDVSSNSPLNSKVAKVFEVTNDDDMAAFDRLPRPLREMIRDAPVNIAVPPIAKYYHARGAGVTCSLFERQIAAVRQRLADEMAEALSR